MLAIDITNETTAQRAAKSEQCRAMEEKQYQDRDKSSLMINIMGRQREDGNVTAIVWPTTRAVLHWW